MSEWPNIEYTAERLLFLYEECHIWFLPHALKNATRLERIRTRSLMLNLHPHWTKLINFWSITLWQFFNRFFSVLILWSYGHPPLCLGNNLHHFLISSIRFLMLNVIVVFVVHNSEEVWETLLVTTNTYLLASIDWLCSWRIDSRLVILKHLFKVLGYFHAGGFVDDALTTPR